MPNKIHITLPNGHKYTVNDPSGTMTDVQAYQFVLQQDPDARNFMAQQKAQDTADHPWRDILSNAPHNLGQIAKGIATTIPTMVKTAGTELIKEGPRMGSGNPLDLVTGLGRAAYNTVGGPSLVEAGKQAVTHPETILPAVKSGLQDQDTMNSMASNLALLPITEGIAKNPVGAGRLVTRPIAAASKAPDALAASLGAQKGLMGVAGGATVAGAEALGLPIPGGPVASGVADLLGVKGGSMVGTTPAADATALVKLAEKNLNVAVAERAKSPGAHAEAAVRSATEILKKAQQDAARSTGVGRLATKAGNAMRAPDRLMRGETAFPQPTVDAVAPPTYPMDGLVPPPAEAWNSATVHAPEGPVEGLPGHGLPQPGWDSAVTDEILQEPQPVPSDLRPPVPGARERSLGLAPAEPPVPPPAPPAPPTPPPTPPSAPPPPPPPGGPTPNPFQSAMDINPANMERMAAQASPQFKALESQGAFGGDRTTGSVTPEAMLPPGRALSTEPLPMGDAAVRANQEASGVLVDASAQRGGILGKLAETEGDLPLSQSEAARLTDAEPTQRLPDANGKIYDAAVREGGRYGPTSEPTELPKPGTRGVAPGGTPEAVLENAKRQGILDKLKEPTPDAFGDAEFSPTEEFKDAGPAVRDFLNGEVPQPGKVQRIQSSEPAETSPWTGSTTGGRIGDPNVIDAQFTVHGDVPKALPPAEYLDSFDDFGNPLSLADRGIESDIPPVTTDSIAAAKAAAQAERAAAEKAMPGKTISDSGKITPADFIDAIKEAEQPKQIAGTAPEPKQLTARTYSPDEMAWKESQKQYGYTEDELNNAIEAAKARGLDATDFHELDDLGPALDDEDLIHSEAGLPMHMDKDVVTGEDLPPVDDPEVGTERTPLARDLAKSENVHGANPDLEGEIPAERGTAADIRARIQERLKDPTSTMAEIRAQGGADRMGTELNPNAPETSTGAVLRTGPAAPSWMPDDVQAAVLRDLQKDPATLSEDSLNKLQRAITQAHNEYVRNGGPRPTPIAQKLHEILTGGKGIRQIRDIPPTKGGGKTGQGEPP